jgi:tRNA uridine 5-carbamoylmethylation protein Kti12
MKIINNIERMNNNIHLDIEEDKERYYIYRWDEFTSVSKKEFKRMKDKDVKEWIEDEFVLYNK